jgi:hypothetical protein
LLICKGSYKTHVPRGGELPPPISDKHPILEVKVHNYAQQKKQHASCDHLKRFHVSWFGFNF